MVCFGLMNISSREMSKQKNDNECDNLWTNVTILENENGNDHENCCYYWVLILSISQFQKSKDKEFGI